MTEPNSNKNIAADGGSIIRLQRAAGTAISAAAVKAKLLVEQEEDHIRRLAALVIKKQVIHVSMIVRCIDVTTTRSSIACIYMVRE